MDTVSDEILVMDKIDVTTLMTPERIIGALIWSLSNGELSDDLIELVKTLPHNMELEGDLGHLPAIIRGGNMRPDIRPHLASVARSEIRSTIRMLKEGSDD